MRSFCRVVIVAFLLASPLLAACGGGVRPTISDPSPYRHEEPAEYYLYLPQAFQQGSRWPLFVGIHGAGGSGRDCWNAWQGYADAEGFVLLCPTITGDGGGWYLEEGERQLFPVIASVLRQYTVHDKVFLVGFSAGAAFANGVAMRYPKQFNGVAVLSAGAFFPPSRRARDVHFLVVVGERDHPLNVEEARAFAAELEKSGFAVSLHVLPGVGHTLSDEARQLTIELFRAVKR